MGIFGKSKAEKEAEERERYYKQQQEAAAAKKTEEAEQQYKKIFQAIERLKTLKIKWDFENAEFSQYFGVSTYDEFNRRDGENIFRLSGKTSEGTSVTISRYSKEYSSKRGTVGLFIEQLKTASTERFQIMNEWISEDVDSKEPNSKAFDYLLDIGENQGLKPAIL